VRRGFAGRWRTDPFSLPDGTPVTKVGLDRMARDERIGLVSDDTPGRT